MLDKRLIYLLAVCIWGCGQIDDPDEKPVEEKRWTIDPEDPFAFGKAFVQSAETRRVTLVDSLVDTQNGYSDVRLRNYGLGDRGWDTLPIWNPKVRRESPGQNVESFEPLFDPETFTWTHESVLALGRRAFEYYPTSIDQNLVNGLDEPQRFGVWSTPDSVGGFVNIQHAGRDDYLGKSCATCHGSTVDGELRHGRPNAFLDYGSLANFPVSWGQGVVDVTPDSEVNPVAIGDLRAIRHQRYLHWTATLHNSPEALAVRVDTLLITALKSQLRPPREVSYALSYYLWSLGEEPTSPDLESEGGELFTQNCSMCHHADGSTGEPVALDVIGTDPLVGNSTMRGTGRYRVPSLYRVSDRDKYFHDASVSSLDELLDPARLGRVPGHEYGLELSPAEREALIAFLRDL